MGTIDTNIDNDKYDDNEKSKQLTVTHNKSVEFESDEKREKPEQENKEKENGEEEIKKEIVPDLSSNTGECYEFTHGFLRDAIYEQMLSTQRIRIHKTAQEYLRKVLKAISFLPDYTNKEIDNRDYTLLLQRHQAITNNYQQQQKNIGPMVTEDTKKKKKKKKHQKVPGFVGLD